MIYSSAWSRCALLCTGITCLQAKSLVWRRRRSLFSSRLPVWHTSACPHFLKEVLIICFIFLRGITKLTLESVASYGSFRAPTVFKDSPHFTLTRLIYLIFLTRFAPAPSESDIWAVIKDLAAVWMQTGVNDKSQCLPHFFAVTFKAGWSGSQSVSDRTGVLEARFAFGFLGSQPQESFLQTAFELQSIVSQQQMPDTSLFGLR